LLLLKKELVVVPVRGRSRGVAVAVIDLEGGGRGGGREGGEVRMTNLISRYPPIHILTPAQRTASSLLRSLPSAL